MPSFIVKYETIFDKFVYFIQTETNKTYTSNWAIFIKKFLLEI